MKKLKLRNIVINEGIPKICVPIMGKNIEELKALYQEMKPYYFDMVEWRMDYFDEIENKEKALEAAEVLRSLFKECPLIFTLRSRKEGGVKEITSHKYNEINTWMIDSKVCDLIDIEYQSEEVDSLIEYAKNNNMPIVLSMHNFNETLPKMELIQFIEKMIEKQIDIYKIAMMPKNEKDVLNLISASQFITEHEDIILVSMSMGESGKVTRVMGEVFGSAITFGCVGQASAPGQMEVDKLRKMLIQVHEANKNM